MNRIKLFVAIGAGLLCQGCLFNDVKLLDLPLPPKDYREVSLEEGSARSRILVLDVDGVISSGTEGEGLLGGGASTVNTVSEKLKIAAEDDTIKAVVLRVDSPGGGVTASDVIYRALKDYKSKTGNRVYVSMLDLAASGGYYISMAGDKLYAHPTTITGSIGVIAAFPQFEDLGKRWGVYMETIKSGENKDLTGGFHNMKDGQRAILQSMVGDMYDRFVSVIHEGRPALSVDRIRELGDGRIYTASQAVENGLIDGIKYLDEVIAEAKSDAGAPNASVFLYRKSAAESLDSFYAKAPATVTPSASTNIGLLNVNADGLLKNPAPTFSYLWMP